MWSDSKKWHVMFSPPTFLKPKVKWMTSYQNQGRRSNHNLIQQTRKNKAHGTPKSTLTRSPNHSKASAALIKSLSAACWINSWFQRTRPVTSDAPLTFWILSGGWYPLEKIANLVSGIWDGIGWCWFDFLEGDGVNCWFRYHFILQKSMHFMHVKPMGLRGMVAVTSHLPSWHLDPPGAPAHWPGACESSHQKWSHPGSCGISCVWDVWG